MTEPFDPEIDPMQDPDSEQPAEEREVSIDDALETDRLAAEGADARQADGYGLDAERERGADDLVAAEQGNRDEDRMEVDADDGQLDEITGADEDLTDREV